MEEEETKINSPFQTTPLPPSQKLKSNIQIESNPKLPPSTTHHPTEKSQLDHSSHKQLNEEEAREIESKVLELRKEGVRLIREAARLARTIPLEAQKARVEGMDGYGDGDEDVDTDGERKRKRKRGFLYKTQAERIRELERKLDGLKRGWRGDGGEDGSGDLGEGHVEKMRRLDME